MGARDRGAKGGLGEGGRQHLQRGKCTCILPCIQICTVSVPMVVVSEGRLPGAISIVHSRDDGTVLVSLYIGQPNATSLSTIVANPWGH